MKIIDFKTVSPLFEMERDGEKPFTIRRVGYQDKRFRALSQWQPQWKWGVRITNPTSGESFIREIKSIDFVRWVDWVIAYIPSRPFFDRLQIFENWKIIVFGELIV